MFTPDAFLNFFFFVFLLNLLRGGAQAVDLNSDAEALLRFRAGLLRSSSAPHWNHSFSPCSWFGVTCSGDRVVSLRLPASGLIGPISTGSIGNLTDLRVLSLRLNAISGDLPPDISGCQQLHSLYLQGNQMSGELPSSLFSLKNLVHIDLSKNNFSGGISVGFANLTLLRSLDLEENQFSGEIPNLNLRDLKHFNVSYNRLRGSVPQNLGSMPAIAFLGMPLCGGPLSPCLNHGRDGNEERKKKSGGLTGASIAGIAAGSASVFLIAVILVIFLYRMKTSGGNSGVRAASVESPRAVPKEINNGEEEAVSGIDKRLVFVGKRTALFDLEDLLRASAEILGRGVYGTVYKAILESGKVVVVKRLSNVSIRYQEFREKAEDIGLMDHQSLVNLLGFYFSRDEKLLVYDFMPKGSISALLHGSKALGKDALSWEERRSTAISVARGIEYIHMSGSSALHGNIKSSNILLDSSHNARVSDQCLWLLAVPSPAVTGYFAPEVVSNPRLVSQKSDVYSFGILLLELLTGKSPTPSAGVDQGIVDLPRWVQAVSPDSWRSEVFDPDLPRDPEAEEGLAELVLLALHCTAALPDQRPPMSEVTARICGTLQPFSTLENKEHHVPSTSNGGGRGGDRAES